MATAQTAKTQYVMGTDGIRYAYRELGPLQPPSHTSDSALPLLLHTHYRANMDFWDPALANALAARRRVVLFDQAGVGRSSGAVATSYAGWAAHVLALAGALRLRRFDLAGFSMGGAAVQMVALAAPPGTVRRLVVLGSTASEPGPAEDGRALVWPREGPPAEPIAVLSGGQGEEGAFEGIARSFFYEDEEGRKHAKAYWARVRERSVEGEPHMLEMLGEEGSKRQRLAYADWATHSLTNSWDRFKELKMPVLVMNGHNDVLIPTSRSWEMSVRIPNAQLIIYPKSGHGFLYQYAELVAGHINMFLDGDGAESAKL